MSAPTIHLPHVTLPDVPHVELSDVSDRATDVWSTGFEKVQDLAAAAIDRAGDLAAAAADRFEDFPDKALTLAGAAIPALRPTPKRSKRPFILLAVVLVVVAGGFWFRRRRSTASDPSTLSPADRTQRAVSAAS
jgi:hypothetical protein